MSTTRQRQSSSSIAIWSCLAVLSLSSAGLASSADQEAEAVRARYEGVFALQEWHTDSGVFRPPQIEGRSVHLNGVIAVITHNRMQEATQTTVASYGTYVFDGTQFSYRYDEPSVFTQTSSGITVSHKAPWEGMRAFSVSREGDTARFRAITGEQEFLLTADGFTYCDKGKVLRVWRRGAPQ